MVEKTRGHTILLDDTSHYPLRIFLKIYEYSRGGRVLFCIITWYMVFASILLPCIKCIKSKREQKKYFNEVSIDEVI